MNEVKSLDEMKSIREQLRKEKKKVVFTNGCFDLIHAGHVDYLSKAREMGDVLIVGLNSDASIKRIKGVTRPILLEAERAFIISNLKAVDYVTIFEEDTPGRIIGELIPDVLVKGADWTIDNIVGRDVVEANGGEVKTIKFVNNQSTSKIINAILNRFGKSN
ncbi:MAG: D-glycero-beta-D-manno-heptose 1-phosphate adenylyltransferase [Ignavibacteriaceae bacterium]|nr:D-glycero-beta-D-manno-heptose 1-phosphate adenylyltransferase [Ignavibacteriaceae bacterium]